MDYKTIKRELRRMGVAHSDAAAFIRVYKKIRQKGKGRMVKDIMAPLMPSGMPVLDLGRRQIGRMWAEHYTPREWLGQSATAYEKLEGRFRLEIARRLAGELVDTNAIVWTQKVEMKGDRPYYVLRGALDVVMPTEKLAPLKHKPYAEGIYDKLTQMDPWGPIEKP